MNTSIKRRDFIKKSAVAAAGTAVLLNTAKCSTKNETLNLAIVGIGNQGRVLLGDCLKLENIKFQAVCDIWSYSQRIAKGRLRKHNPDVNVYSDYKEMLEKEKDLDAVIIATPDFKHAEHTVACLEAGLHVYCEKEMSNNLDEAKKMVEASKSTKKLLQIGHQRRSNPLYQQALKAIEEDDILGRITNCYAQWNKSVQNLLTWSEKYEMDAETLNKYGFNSMKEFMNWRWFKKYSAGPVSDLGSHQIDIFSWYLNNDPESILAMGGSDFYEGRDWYEDVMAIYNYKYTHAGKEGSTRAYYQVLNTNGYGGFYERYHGTKGTLTISEFTNKSIFVPEPGAELPEWVNSVEPIQEGTKTYYPLTKLLSAKSPQIAELIKQMDEKTTYMWHLENFLNAVRNKSKKMLNCDGEEGYKTAVAVLNVIPAVESGQKIKFKENEFIA